MEAETQENTIRLRSAILRWFVCLVIFIGMLVLYPYLEILGALAFVFYIAAGIYLNKSVLPRLISWHEHYDTLENVTSEKAKLFIGWPVTYFFLLAKLTINKIL